MRNQVVTSGIVLSRTDFGEADRILTFLTPDHGKVRAIAKGVRRIKSKLAGGIELFSISHITFLPGKKEIGTLISTRLDTYYDNIVKDINRTMLGYELLKRVNRVTEDAAGEEYFSLLQSMLVGLNDLDLSLELIELWFSMQLLKITGHSPNLTKDNADNSLEDGQTYLFDFESMAFSSRAGAPYSANHIKLIRLAIGLKEPMFLKQVKDSNKYITDNLHLAKNMTSNFLRI